MKRAKYVLLVLFLLLVVITVIELKTCIHIDDSSINHKFILQKDTVSCIQDSLAIKMRQRNLSEKEALIPSKPNRSIAIYNVSQLSISEWNTPYGIPYVQVPGANLGVTSFEIIDKERVAYLSDASSEIIITKMDSGKAIKKFPVLLAPRDFIYDNSLFYVLGERQVIVYDENGIERNQFDIPVDYYGRAGRLTRFDSATYLLLVSGNCLKIESGGASILSQEYEGWITSSGSYFSTQVKGDNRYSVKIIRADGKISEKVFVTDNDKKAAGVFVIGTTKNRIVLDVQTFISENPIAVERFIVSVILQKDDFGEIINSIKVPDSYYVLSNKEFYLSTTGEVINMVTSPTGVYIFSLSESTSNDGKGYPISVASEKYHFNNHLMETERK